MPDLVLAVDDAPLGDDALIEAASRVIEAGRIAIARDTNLVVVAANWQLGKLIDREILGRGRADYGKQIYATLSHELTTRFGPGFDETNLRRMVKFARQYPEEIQATLSPELSWSHVRELLPLRSAEARAFYAGEVAAKRLGVRELRDAISKKAFERREIANAQIPQGSAMPLDAFRDPMLLDFIGLTDDYLEIDLERAVLQNLEQFLLEAGNGLAFVGRQVRIPWKNKDYHLDMLFYSRPLSRLVAVDFKLGDFEPEYEAQMRFYLNWLDQNERRPGEEAPIGLILCATADRDQVELMGMHKDNIVVAEYWTELLPKKELEDRLQEILRQARERMARRAITAVAETEED
jgi:predicted nuclease of restriction endonuclease-like (RecB) superfamily